LTYNGTVINKPPDKVNTEINLAIMRKYDEEDEKFDYAKEMKKVNDNKYLKTLNLDANVKKEIDIRKFIKINTAPTYVPCIYCDQNTKFRINFGATAFRNRQPEFQAGILYKLSGEFEKFLDGNPKHDSGIMDVDDMKNL
jgi:biotin synthase-like enzyme